MNKKIFIMETDGYSSQMLADTLESFDYEPIIFDECEDLTLQMIESEPYMVIANSRIFKKNKHVFIRPEDKNPRNFDSCLVITSGDLVDPEEILLLEADFFLFKPYDMRILADLLEKINAIIYKDVTGTVPQEKKGQLTR